MAERLYLESSIISYYTARPTTDSIKIARQKNTREWWDNYRNIYELYISPIVIDEISQGDALAAKNRLNLIQNIPQLEPNLAVKNLALNFIQDSALPEKAYVDAIHIAIATIHKMDYLLTYNCTHIANAQILPKTRKICSVTHDVEQNFL